MLIFNKYRKYPYINILYYKKGGQWSWKHEQQLLFFFFFLSDKLKSFTLNLIFASSKKKPFPNSLFRSELLIYKYYNSLLTLKAHGIFQYIIRILLISLILLNISVPTNEIEILIIDRSCLWYGESKWRVMVYLCKDGRNTESSQNGLERTLKILSSSSPPAVDSRDDVDYISLIKGPSNLALNSSRGGASTAPLGSLLQCLWVKNF